jgi:hypothetical protein
MRNLDYYKYNQQIRMETERRKGWSNINKRRSSDKNWTDLGLFSYEV